MLIGPNQFCNKLAVKRSLNLVEFTLRYVSTVCCITSKRRAMPEYPARRVETMSVTLGDILSTRLPLDLKATSTSSRTPTALSCFLVRSHSYNPTRSKQKTPGLAVSHDKRFLSKILQAAKSQLDPDVRMDEGLPADGRLKWAGFSGWRRPLRILAGFLYGYEVGESGEGLVIGDELGLQSHLLNYVYGLVGFVLKSSE